MSVSPHSILVCVVVCIACQAHAAESELPPSVGRLVSEYCLDCHSSGDPAAQLDLESLTAASFLEETANWEKVVRRLRTRQMPPSDALRPDEPQYRSVIQSLETTLDAHAAEHPQPGRSDTFRRLTRFEYQNAVRDLLGVEMEVSTLLPEDQVSHGFDNITVGELSPTLLNRYISAAQKISRLALGRASNTPDVTTIRVRPDITQEQRVEGLPIGTRGGALIPFHFPESGQYEIRVRLARDRDEHVEGLSEPHELEVLIDRNPIDRFTVKPPERDSNKDVYGQPAHDDVDQHLVSRLTVNAGPHDIGVTFLKNPDSLLERSRQPLNVHYNV